MTTAAELHRHAMLRWHLTGNHYPPIRDGERFALAAIEAVREGRDDDPVEDTASGRYAPHAWEVVESWHLHDFIDAEDDEL